MRVTASDLLSSAAHVLPLACRQRRTMPHTVVRVHAMAMVFVLFLVAMCSGVSVAAPHSPHSISEASLWGLAPSRLHLNICAQQAMHRAVHI